MIKDDIKETNSDLHTENLVFIDKNYLVIYQNNARKERLVKLFNTLTMTLNGLPTYVQRINYRIIG